MNERQQQEFNCSFPIESEEVRILKKDRSIARVGSLVIGSMSAGYFSIIDYGIFSGSLTDIFNRYQAHQRDSFVNDYTGFCLAVLYAGFSLTCLYLGRRWERSARQQSALEQKLFEDEQDHR